MQNPTARLSPMLPLRNKHRHSARASKPCAFAVPTVALPAAFGHEEKRRPAGRRCATTCDQVDAASLPGTIAGMHRLLFVVAFTACLWASAFQLQAHTLSDAGQLRATVVVAADAPAPVRHAADELRYFLSRVTGTDFLIRHNRSPEGTNLLVGPKAARLRETGFTTDDLGEDGIVLRSVGDDLILAGGAPRGTLYAVFTFLEDHAGCHWWTPAASHIPRRPNLKVPKLNFRYVPRLEYRDMSFLHTAEADFSVRNKLNGHHHRLFYDNSFNNIGQDSSRGGRKYAYIRSDKWGSHGWWTLIEPEVYFKSHPEWFALINGKRTHISPKYPISNLCLTNESMRAELTKNARLALRWNPHATVISIAQPDDAGPPNRCECAACAAVEQEGNPSELVIRFVNAVAADLQEQFPDVAVSTLAYHYSQKPPKQTRPRPNVLVRLSSIKCSFSRPMTDERNSPFRADLEGWSKMCDRLYLWDYPINFAYPLPHPNLRVYGPNLRYYTEHNVKGMFCEGGAFAELVELRAWLLAKLMWNPNADSNQLIDTFVRGYYGQAGSHILDYIQLTHNAVEATDDFLGLGSRPDATFLSLETLLRAWEHVQAAAAAVANDPILAQRVQVTRLPIMFVFLHRWNELHAAAKDAGLRWPMGSSQQELHADIVALASAHGINLKGISSPIPF